MFFSWNNLSIESCYIIFAPGLKLEYKNLWDNLTREIAKTCHPICRIFSGPNAAAACAGCCLMKDGKCRGYAVDLILNDVYHEWISSKQMISKFRNTWVLWAKLNNLILHLVLFETS